MPAASIQKQGSLKARRMRAGEPQAGPIYLIVIAPGLFILTLGAYVAVVAA
jgi:hypothetical protein